MDYKKVIKSKKIRFKIISLFRFIPDKKMLKIQYKIKSGRTLNLVNPHRYTEKIQWYKLYYRDELMKKCASKYGVREYIKSKGLEEILNELYAVYNKPEDICFDNLPNKFVLKLSNGSGTNLIIEDKNSVDIKYVIDKFKDYKAQVKAYAGREWVYREKTPVILAEKYIEDYNRDDREITDYKFFCFNGEPEYVICVCDRGTENYNHAVYDVEWNKLDVTIGKSLSNVNYKRPETLDEMIGISKTLSEGFPAVRIDLYSVEGKVYFGEMTFFPWSGYMDFQPDEFDYILGEKFILPKKQHST